MTIGRDVLIPHLFSFFKKPLDLEAARVYALAVEHVSDALLAAAVDRARITRKFLPKPTELLEDVEACRSYVEPSRAVQEGPGCPKCTSGFVPVTDDRGVDRMAFCECHPARRNRTTTTAPVSPPRRGGAASTVELAEDVRRTLRVVGSKKTEG